MRNHVLIPYSSRRGRASRVIGYIKGKRVIHIVRIRRAHPKFGGSEYLLLGAGCLDGSAGTGLGPRLSKYLLDQERGRPAALSHALTPTRTTLTPYSSGRGAPPRAKRRGRPICLNTLFVR